MKFETLLRAKGIKHRKICEVLGITESCFSRRLQRNSSFTFAELAALRSERIIDLEDLDLLTQAN